MLPSISRGSAFGRGDRMRADEVQGELRVVIEKRSFGWFVRNPDGFECGPYNKASIAVTIAVKQVLQSRRFGGEAHVAVGQEGGHFSRCNLADLPAAPCDGCENLRGVSAPKCPLRAELFAE
jgi:hypothetical protein